MLRALVALLMAMSLSGLSHAAEEAVESAVHVADTGHDAHAEHRPEDQRDSCPDPCPDQCCPSTVHNCGCCPTAVAATDGSSLFAARAAEPVGRAAVDDVVVLDGIRKRIDRPPRA